MADGPEYDEFFVRLPVGEACDVLDLALYHAGEAAGAARSLAEHLVAPLDRPTSFGQTKLDWDLRRTNHDDPRETFRRVAHEMTSSWDDRRASKVARLALAILLQRTAKEALDFIADVEAAEDSRFG